MKVQITSSYGFDHNWTLCVDEKEFYLGQDVKFCSRVLGMSPSYVVQQIGSGELEDPKINTRLAKFIVKSLGLTKKKLMSMNTWDLCSQ
jgi:hypothetical protein